jgi:mRNA-degrading endonuclease RelE of RelBE toxin-antitoxin system
MTAYEVIDQIKALPPTERAKVLDFVRELEAKQPPVSYAENQAFADAAKWAFGEHADLMRKLSQ